MRRDPARHRSRARPVPGLAGAGAYTVVRRGRRGAAPGAGAGRGDPRRSTGRSRRPTATCGSGASTTAFRCCATPTGCRRSTPPPATTCSSRRDSCRPRTGSGRWTTAGTSAPAGSASCSAQRTLDSDMTARTLGWYRVAEKEYLLLSTEARELARLVQRRRQRLARRRTRVGGLAGVHRALGRRRLQAGAVDAGRLAGLAEVDGVEPRPATSTTRSPGRGSPWTATPAQIAELYPSYPYAERAPIVEAARQAPAGRGRPAAPAGRPRRCCTAGRAWPGQPRRCRRLSAAATGWAATRWAVAASLTTTGTAAARQRPAPRRGPAGRALPDGTALQRTSARPARTTSPASAGPASPASRWGTTTTSRGG